MDTEYAWAAGFFEGEGCVTANSNKPKRTIKLNVGQSGEECPPNLLRFKAAVGKGKITGPYGPYLVNRKPTWQFNVSGKDVPIVFALLLPYFTADSPKVVRYRELMGAEDVKQSQYTERPPRGQNYQESIHS